MFSGFSAEDFPHQPPCIIHRRVHSPADLPQPERPALAFEPGRADEQGSAESIFRRPALPEFRLHTRRHRHHLVDLHVFVR